MGVIKFSYNQFNLLKSTTENKELDKNIDYIRKIISGSRNRNKFNKHNRNNKKIELNSNLNKWRLKKTVIKKNIDTEKDKYIYEINSLLNKMSSKNYDKIILKIMNYFKKDNENLHEELIKAMIDNIFLKAVTQPVYCALYVRFIKHINEHIKIHKYLDSKCSEYKDILGKQSSNDSLSDYDKFCEENKAKVFKVGYSQFIGELFNNALIKENVISENITSFIENFKIIIKKNSENNEIIESIIICLSKLITTTYSNLKNKNFSIEDFYSNRGILCKRLQFKIEDIKEFINK